MEIGKDYAVQMHDITIKFGSYAALDRVQLDVKKGSIHAVLGENGAGKTTLMNILYGLYQANGGDIYLYGEKVEMKNPMWRSPTGSAWCISISCWWTISR